MELSETMYAHLRAIAGRYLQGRHGHTLQPTALVNEAYLKLAKQEPGAIESRAHFMALAARIMRHVLVDHARRKSTEKRGGGRERVTLDQVVMDDHERALDVLALDAALSELARLDARHARVVELKVFAGMTSAEMARVLGLSVATVERDWTKARAWLRVQMAGD